MNDFFSDRHLGPADDHVQSMLKSIGFQDLDTFTRAVAPAAIRTHRQLDIGAGVGEADLLKRARELAGQNQVFKSFIGKGYYGTHTPAVILRNILENPGWYTAYTPYQAEISQGRMEALLNFQTMISDLTGLEMANASLLDEGTALAEAVTMAFHHQKKNPRHTVLVDENIFPQSLEVLRTRCEPLDIEVRLEPLTGSNTDFTTSFALVVQYPDATGDVRDLEKMCASAKDAGAQIIAATDLLALCVLKAPGEWGADIAVGSSQRFGVPFGFGGPHAAFLSARADYQRLLPGRIIGVSKDAEGQRALRLALQTREQHIRREKATSNICTAQVLLAVMASMYAVYHGPKGLRTIAERVHRLTGALKFGLEALGLRIVNESHFDTLTIDLSNAGTTSQWQKEFATRGINLGSQIFGSQNLQRESYLQIALDETTSVDDVETLLQTAAQILKKSVPAGWDARNSDLGYSPSLQRTSAYLTHPTFNTYHSETEMLRYMHRLEQKDLTLNQAMIPLGSCTMKLNATTEMIPVTWPEFSNIHPFAPLDQAQGYLKVIRQLEAWLCDITGFKAISFQPNAGSQGEYAGLLVIRKFHQSRGDQHRNVCLIPSSAHGTNPASAVMAGFKVVVVACDQQGNVDLNDLRAKAAQHEKNLAALMITYPSTHGVFEAAIREICEVIHKHGGQVYMDGANFNALVGVSRPGEFGADVSHLNLHKTFCIPHGGGGPGVGPIGVAEHLVPFLPTHSLRPECGPATGIGAVSAAPWGSAGILLISWAYIHLMGSDGLKRASQVAILNANYMAKRLAPHFPILYTGQNGLVAHECIIDVRQLRESADVTVDDIAKRLMDYGFHAPTMSWPVAGTLMIEPTESESLAELDRFCDAMISIRAEIKAIEEGRSDRANNVLKNAPHTVRRMTADSWPHPYKRDEAAFPLPWVRDRKFWPAVSRVDNAFGDRNLVCSCPPMESYEA
jgi:glycine dehydrogenase